MTAWAAEAGALLKMPPLRSPSPWTHRRWLRAVYPDLAAVRIPPPRSSPSGSHSPHRSTNTTELLALLNLRVLATSPLGECTDPPALDSLPIVMPPAGGQLMRGRHAAEDGERRTHGMTAVPGGVAPGP